jgi:hypothetical protein
MVPVQLVLITHFCLERRRLCALPWKLLFGCYSKVVVNVRCSCGRSQPGEMSARVSNKLFIVWIYLGISFVLFTLLVYFSVYTVPLGVQSVSLYVVCYLLVQLYTLLHVACTIVLLLYSFRSTDLWPWGVQRGRVHFIKEYFIHGNLLLLSILLSYYHFCLFKLFIVKEVLY